MSWIKRLKTFGNQVIISIILLEIGAGLILKLRYAIQQEFVFKQLNPTGSFSPTKDYVYPIRENAKFQWIRKDFTVEVRTNSFGLREDFEVKLSEIDTVFFGDSFTFGHGVEGNERYSYVYASNLKFPEKKLRAANAYNNTSRDHISHHRLIKN